MRSIWRNEDNPDNSGKSGLEPKLPRSCAVSQTGPLPRPWTQDKKPHCRNDAEVERVLSGLKMLLIS